MLEIGDIAVANLLAYGLPEIIERNRVKRDDQGNVVWEIPWALCAAIGHIESEQDPFVFNYYQKDESGKKHLRRGRWDGQPETLPDGEGDRPNAWAAGWLQIIRPYPRELTLAQRFDPEAESRVLFPEWHSFYAKAQAAGLTGRDLWAAVYFGHNQGAGSLKNGLPHAAKGIVSIINNSGITDGALAQGALVVAIHVATLVPQYAALEDQIKAAQTQAGE